MGIIDILNKSDHFLHVRMTFSIDQFTKLYVNEVVRMHGVSISIVSHKDQGFISDFWKILHRAMETELKFSTTFYPKYIENMSE